MFSFVTVLVFLDISFRLLCNPENANIVSVHMGMKHADKMLR
jgi:hypothetical protein